jgi:hypothetical protein
VRLPRELVTISVKEAPATTVEWFAWCNVRPTKTMRDEREIDRARRALAPCVDGAHEVVGEEG